MTGLTIIGLHFQYSYKNVVATFRNFGDKKVLVNRKMEIFLFDFLYTSFRISMYNLIETYLKGFIR